MMPDMMPRDPINFLWTTAAALLCLAGILAVSWWRNRR